MQSQHVSRAKIKTFAHGGFAPIPTVREASVEPPEATQTDEEDPEPFPFSLRFYFTYQSKRLPCANRRR
jgi:hypothetical protein